MRSSSLRDARRAGEKMTISRRKLSAMQAAKMAMLRTVSEFQGAGGRLETRALHA